MASKYGFMFGKEISNNVQRPKRA